MTSMLIINTCKNKHQAENVKIMNEFRVVFWAYKDEWLLLHYDYLFY